MSTVSFVMGPTASGKTYFINQNFFVKDVVILNIFDYQKKAFEASGFNKSMPIQIQFRCLMNANDSLLTDIIDKLK